MKTEIIFKWRNLNLKDSILAVCYAVYHGYSTREQLERALPQFSKLRILMSLEILLSANMAEINMETLTINSDMKFLEEIVGNPIMLPVYFTQLEAKDKKQLIRSLIVDLGFNNPAGVENLVKVVVK